MALLCITNASLVMPNAVRRGGILVGDDGRIEAVLDAGERPAAETSIDARDRLLFPGFVDAHVHMRDPGFTHKEDFTSGTEAAACAGVTTVMCMPNTNPPVSDLAGFEAAKQAGERGSLVDFTLQAAVTRANLEAMPALWDAGISSFEALLSDAPPNDRLDIGQFATAAETVARLGAVVGVYTGSQPLVDRALAKFRQAGRTDFRAFAEARAPLGEAIGIASVIEVARATGARIVLRQVSTARGFALVRAAKGVAAALPLATEVTPHHLHLEVGELDRQMGFAQMIPPLRETADCEAAVAALADGTADFVGSDHAPHSVEEKSGATPWETAGGTPGLDTIVPAVLDLAVRGRIAVTKVAEALAARPAELFGLAGRKGTLSPGADGDLVLVDPDLERAVTAELIRSKAGRSPFEGRRLRGWPVLTVLRGRVIAEEGMLVGGGAGGRFLARDNA